MQNTVNELAQEQSMKLQDVTDFTLKSHYSERIAYHMKMLNYYFNEALGA